MKLFRSWPLYVVMAIFLGYLVFSEDESPEEGNGPTDEVVESPGRFPTGPMNQPPVWQGGPQYNVQEVPPTGYQTYPGTQYAEDPAQSNRYRFRPVEPSDYSENRHPPSYTFSDRQEIYGPPAGQQGYGPMPQQSPSPGQADMNYRFRPLDQSKQSRRWSGNYPYTQPNYYTPQHRTSPPMGGGDSLWAESAPKR